MSANIPDEQTIIAYTPESNLGDVVAEIIRSRGLIKEIGSEENLRTVIAQLPIFEVEKFRKALTKITHGAGVLKFIEETKNDL